MGAPTNLDIRQSETRVLQDQLNLNSVQPMDSTLASINSELIVPGRLIAQVTPSLVVSVGPGIVTNPNTSKHRTFSPFNNTIINFPGGTITFPSTSGTITVSPGINSTITIGPNQFAAILVQLTTAGNIALSVGANAGSLGAVVVPNGDSQSLSLGYIIVQTNGAGVIQTLTDNALYQFTGGGGSSSPAGGIAQEVPLTIGTTTVNVVFGTPQPNASYAVLGQIVNETDANPQYIPVVITAKSTTGFSASWNVPLPTGNYLLDYAVEPGIAQQQNGEQSLLAGTTSVVISIIPMVSPAYVAIATMVDYTDVNPQFQPVTVTAKTTSTFTVQWNAPTGSANYRLAWQIAAYQ